MKSTLKTALENVVKTSLVNVTYHPQKHETIGEIGRRTYLEKAVSDNDKLHLAKAINDWYNGNLTNAIVLAKELLDAGKLDAAIAIRVLAKGRLPISEEKYIEGLKIVLDNWEVLGYDSVQNAVQDYVVRTR